MDYRPTPHNHTTPPVPAPIPSVSDPRASDALFEHIRDFAELCALAQDLVRHVSIDWPSSATFEKGAASVLSQADSDLVQSIASCYPGVSPEVTRIALRSARCYRFAWGAIFESRIDGELTWRFFYPPHPAVGRQIPEKLAEVRADAVAFLNCLGLLDEMAGKPWPVAIVATAGFAMLSLASGKSAEDVARRFMRERFAPSVVPRLAAYLAQFYDYGLAPDVPRS